MKATLKFTCDDDEEETDKLQLILKAPDILRALHAIKDLLRSWEKYGLPERIDSFRKNEEHYEFGELVVEKLREEINTIIYERVGEI